MERFKRQIRYDIHTGTLLCWKLYAGYFAIWILLALVIWRSHRFMMENRDNMFSWLDCIIGFLRGTEDFSKADRTETFRMPFEWFVLNLGYILWIISYPYFDYKERGYQFFIRAGNKKNWWFSKCVWTVFQTLLYFLMFYIVIYAVTICMGGEWIWNEHDIWGMNLENIPKIHLFLLLFIMPVITAITFSLLGLTISFLWNPIGAVIFLLLLLVASAYWENDWLLGCYSMLCRYDFEELAANHKIIKGILLNTTISAVSILMGYYTLKYREVMRKGW